MTSLIVFSQLRPYRRTLHIQVLYFTHFFSPLVSFSPAQSPSASTDGEISLATARESRAALAAAATTIVVVVAGSLISRWMDGLLVCSARFSAMST